MLSHDFKQDYFKLFGLPVQFALDQAQLGARYRQLQAELHPDRFVTSSAHEQRLAVQYSAMVNEAYATLRKPLGRALYLLQLGGIDEQQVSAQKIDGGFLMEQMDLREKLDSIGAMVDPDASLDHLVTEIVADIRQHREEFAAAYAAAELSAAAQACVKMQYLDKLLREAEQLETDLMDKQ